MRIRLVLAVLALVSLSFPASAIVAVAAPCDPHNTTLEKCAGEECDSNAFGASTMDKDHENIIVCLQKGPNKIWKASTGEAGGVYNVWGTTNCGSGTTIYTGLVLTGTTYSGAGTSWAGAAGPVCKAGGELIDNNPNIATVWSTSYGHLSYNNIPCALCKL